MTPEMKLAIDKAISEHLTGAMAGELKVYLEQVETTKAALEKLQENHEYTSQENRDLRAKLSRYEALDKRRAELDSRAADLDKRDLQLEHDTAKNAVAVAQAELKGFREVIGLVFRNTSVHNNITRRVGVPVEGNRGGNGYGSSPGFVVPSDETESTTTTQS